MSVHVTTQATVESQQGSLDLPRILYANYAGPAYVSSTAISASSSAANFPADAAHRPDTYERWKPSALLAWWKADLGSAKTVNSLGAAAHTLHAAGCTARVQYSTDNSVWSNASDVATPSNSTPMLFLFPQQTARYWRLLVDGATSPTGSTMPEIGSIYVGAVLAVQRQVYGGVRPPALSRETVMDRTLSEGGHFLGQHIRRVGFKTSVEFKHLTAAWVRSTFDPFVESAREYPFFYAWRSSDHPEDCVYAWATGDIRPSNMGVRSYMQASFGIEAYGNE